MNISDEGLRLICSFEGYHTKQPDGSCKAYRCPAGVWTCGYGCTVDVGPNTHWTRVEAEQKFRKELDKFEADYGWVLPVFFEEKARLETEAARRAAEIEAAHARERPAQQGAALSNEEVAALNERLAAIEAENAESKAKIDDMLKAAAKIESGGV